ncbi:enoyl-CoA hydratase/isomerase family protein [Spirosoma lituiforme]
MATLSEYANKYPFLKMEREEGILQVTFHDNGGPLVITDALHATLGYAWNDIGSDRENKVIILTGTGDVFCTGTRGSDPTAFTTPDGLSRGSRDGRNMFANLFDIEAPVIAAVNGPAHVHADLMVANDIVLAAEHTTFQDFHMAAHMVIGGIAQVIWQEVLGIVRGKYFLLTGQVLTAQQALDYGVVNEVLPKEQLLPRAWELARAMVKQPPLTLRHTRIALNQRFRQRFLEEGGYGYTLIGLGLMDQVRQAQAQPA